MTARDLKEKLDALQKAKEAFLQALVELYGPRLALKVLCRAGLVGQAGGDK